MLRMNWRRSWLLSRPPCLPNQASGYAHGAEAYHIASSNLLTPMYTWLALTVTVEIRNERFLATARLLTGDERTQAWAKAVAVFPAYGEYQKETIRELPVFLLERGANA